MDAALLALGALDVLVLTFTPMVLGTMLAIKLLRRARRAPCGSATIVRFMSEWWYLTCERPAGHLSNHGAFLGDRLFTWVVG